MGNKLCPSNVHGARGQSYLELASALPVLLVLIMGLVEVGFLMRAQLVLTNATREGARLASRGIGDEKVVERTVSAFSHQLPTDLDTNTGIAVTRFFIPGLPGDPEVTSTTYFTGTFDSVSPTCTSRVSPGYRAALVAENEDFDSPHDVVIVEVCHNYHLSFLPVTRVLYDKTTMRIAVQRAQ
jgi:hypothetical protein